MVCLQPALTSLIQVVHLVENSHLTGRATVLIPCQILVPTHISYQWTTLYVIAYRIRLVHILSLSLSILTLYLVYTTATTYVHKSLGN